MSENRESTNHMHLFFDSKSANERFARMTVAAFMADMNPTLEDVADVKTAVSEAVTNAMIHGYEHESDQVELLCQKTGKKLTISVIDHGIGIEDIEKARQPFFTTKDGTERAGMGFAFMEAFMDEVYIESSKGSGTKVTMHKYIERDQAK